MNERPVCHLCRLRPVKTYCVAYGRLIVDICAPCHRKIVATTRRKRRELSGQQLFRFMAE